MSYCVRFVCLSVSRLILGSCKEDYKLTVLTIDLVSLVKIFVPETLFFNKFTFENLLFKHCNL